VKRRKEQGPEMRGGEKARYTKKDLPGGFREEKIANRKKGVNTSKKKCDAAQEKGKKSTGRHTCRN